jgi:SAM-dependent methyltransferase
VNRRSEPACPWCSGACATTQPPTTRPDWPRALCRTCGTIFYPAAPDPGSLSAIYAEAWSAERESGANGSTSILAASSLVRRMTPASLGSAHLLDYGAGGGALSRALAQVHREAEIHAYEPFGPACSYPGVAWSDTADEPWSDRFYDIIFLCEVIEHVPDPTALLADLRQRLKPGGRIALTTPNARGLRARRQGGAWREAQNPAHLCLFTQQSLDLCAKRAGFHGFERLHAPVRYKSEPLRQLCLSALQIVGLDGGLRGFLRN